MPPFSFIMKKADLFSLLTVCADDQDVEVMILDSSDHIAVREYASFV